MDAIVGRVCETFDIDHATAARDAAAFVDSLCQRGLLTVEDTPSPAA
jgi:hypothetical protein